jgi:serine/threonine protein phosphatase PrpC
MSNLNKNSVDGNVLTIKTVQIAPFRTLMTALKDILLETNITFQPDGIRIINMDKSHTILVHLHLAAQNFEFYECKKDKFIIMASDGLWDVLSNQDVVDFILFELAKKTKSSIAKKLVKHAFDKGSQDNITVIIIFL